LLDCALSPPGGQDQSTTAKPSGVGNAAQTAEPLEETEVPVALDRDSVGMTVRDEIPAVRDGAEIPNTDISHDIDSLRSHWREFIKSLRGEGSSGNLDAFLRSACDPIALEDDTLVLGFYYSFHKEKIEDAKYRHLVEKKLKDIFGRPYKIRCVLVDHKPEIQSEARIHNPVIKAALEMGARISEEEP